MLEEAAARDGRALDDHRQLGAGLGAGGPVEPRHLALGEGLRCAYNYGRPQQRGKLASLSLLELTGF